MDVEFLDAQDQPPPPTRRVRRRWWLVLGVGLLLAVGIGIGVGGRGSTPVAAPSSSLPPLPLPQPFRLGVATGDGIVCSIQPEHSCDTTTGLTGPLTAGLTNTFHVSSVQGDVVSDLPFSHTLGYSALVTVGTDTVLVIARRAAGSGDVSTIGPLPTQSVTRDGWQLIAATTRGPRLGVHDAVSRWLASGPLPE